MLRFKKIIPKAENELDSLKKEVNKTKSALNTILRVHHIIHLKPDTLQHEINSLNSEIDAIEKKIHELQEENHFQEYEKQNENNYSEDGRLFYEAGRIQLRNLQ